MKRSIFFITLLLGVGFSMFGQSNPEAILGEWLSSKKDSRIVIYKNGTKYYGKVSWGTGPTKDERNPDPSMRNEELIGQIILKDFVFDQKDNRWTNGTIYDPHDGKTYSCKMTLIDSRNLSIRGYVGITLFGRSETWTKVN